MSPGTAALRVGVLGAGGRMGTEVCRAVGDAPDMVLAAAVDPAGGRDASGTELARDPVALTDAECCVAVDFTHPDAAPANVDWCLDHGVHVVVGTSGFDAARLEAIGRRAEAAASNVIVVPNFAIGAVLMMRFAEMAAPFMERVEVIELHHDAKADAPSGTAQSTAERLSAARAAVGGWPERGDSVESVPGSRGGLVGGVRVHSVRLPGLVAHQEVIFGATGQTLTLRHDSIDRSSFMPGVLLAVRSVADRPGLTVGLDPLLGI